MIRITPASPSIVAAKNNQPKPESSSTYGVVISACNLCLQALELRVVDDALRSQVGELRDLVGGTAAHRAADVLACGRVLCLRHLHRVLVHLAAARDQVDEDTEVGQHDDEDRPQCLAPAAEFGTAEDVREDGDQ